MPDNQENRRRTTRLTARRRPARASARAAASSAKAPRLRAVDAEKRFPLPKSNFRVYLNAEEFSVASVSPLHLPDGKHMDPDLRQTVVLRRAVSASRIFFDWNSAIRAGKEDVRTVTITLLDGANGKPAGIWQLTSARAVRGTCPDFDALADEIAMEEIEITYESVMEKPHLTAARTLAAMTVGSFAAQRR